VIRVCELKKSYHPKSAENTHAVRGVSFTINPGQVLGLIGPSGCGKSTIAKLIAGLIQPDSGVVETAGWPGFVSQDPYSALSPVMKIRDIVAEPLRWRKGSKDVNIVKHAMDRVRLDFDKFKDRLPSELSGGERQRVSIARALIATSGTLILDEPVSMLDYDVKQEITDILCDLVADSNYAVLLISHDIGFVRDIASHVAVMEQGLIIEEGTPGEICSNPQEELTKKLVLAALDLKTYLEISSG